MKQTLGIYGQHHASHIISKKNNIRLGSGYKVTDQKRKIEDIMFVLYANCKLTCAVNVRYGRLLISVFVFGTPYNVILSSPIGLYICCNTSNSVCELHMVRFSAVCCINHIHFDFSDSFQLLCTFCSLIHLVGYCGETSVPFSSTMDFAMLNPSAGVNNIVLIWVLLSC